jgi:hypothetical protein
MSFFGEFEAFGEEEALGREVIGGDVAAELEHNSSMLEFQGLTSAIGWLEGIARRIANPTAIMGATAFPALEQAERELFASLGGRYVDTGRTRDSLTTRTHPDAIREVHIDELVFGTSVPYAVFLTEDEAGGRHTGGSAVLVDPNSIPNLDESLLTGFTGEPPS